MATTTHRRPTSHRANRRPRSSWFARTLATVAVFGAIGCAHDYLAAHPAPAPAAVAAPSTAPAAPELGCWWEPGDTAADGAQQYCGDLRGAPGDAYGFTPYGTADPSNPPAALATTAHR